MGAASFDSFPAMFQHRVKSTPDTEAFSFPVSEGGKETWKSLTWAEVDARVRAIAGGLLAQGLNPEDRCVILSSTRVEWLLIDLGILSAGGATTTIYPSNTAEECAFIVTDSGSRFIFVEDDGQLDKILSVRDQLPEVVRIINITGRGGEDGFVLTLDELEKAGDAWNKENPGRIDEIVKALKPDNLATLIYTSGTTGRSKGVELTHEAWVFEGESVDKVGMISPADRQYLFLPLAHSFGKVLEAIAIRIGVPTAVDGRIDRIVDNLAVVRPTFMAAVPRVFEKVYNKIVAGAKEGGGLKFRIFTWALAVGRECSRLRQQGREPGGLLAVKERIAHKLVFSKVQERFGGRIRFFISGSAPLSKEIAEFFHAVGMLIIEGYGLTESSAASCVNRPDKYRFGTVGPALPGVLVRIDESDGEILLGGPGIMRGYHNLPEVTAETLSIEDGVRWLRTGDIGQLDADGFLKITDRKKDLIKTSGGKYVAPQELENKLKLLSPLISQVLVHGNMRNFCTALVTLDAEAAKKWAAEHGKSGLSYEEITKLDEMKAEIQKAVDQLNSGLARYETIKKFAILPADFSIETGELTPTQKVKRKLVEARYKAVLDSFYEGTLEQV